MRESESDERTVFSSRFACRCRAFSIEEIEPRPVQLQFGRMARVPPVTVSAWKLLRSRAVVPDERLSLADGAIILTGSQRPLLRPQTLQSLAGLQGDDTARRGRT